MRKSILAGVVLALTMVGGVASARNLSDWDSESNGYISTDEFYSGVADNGYYGANADGHWDNGEWDDAVSNGFFDM